MGMAGIHPCGTGRHGAGEGRFCRQVRPLPQEQLCSPTPPAREGGLPEPNQRLEVLAEKQRVGEDTETTLPWLRGDYLITALQMHAERAPSTVIQATFAVGLALLLEEPH